MHVFKHPKFYKELRKRNNLDQAISGKNSTECKTRSPGPGQTSSVIPEASSSSSSSSDKQQAVKSQAINSQAQAQKE